MLDRQFTSLDEVVAYCSDRVMMLYAGSMAENVLCGQVNDEQVCDDLKSPKAADDHSKVRENLRVIAGIECRAGEDPQAAINRVKDRLWQQASSLVIRFDREIEELAGALQRQINAAGEKAVITGWTSPDLGAAQQVDQGEPPKRR